MRARTVKRMLRLSTLGQIPEALGAITQAMRGIPDMEVWRINSPGNKVWARVLKLSMSRYCTRYGAARARYRTQVPKEFR